MAKKKRIVFLTGTRADFGKLKALMTKVVGERELELHIFVTGMHTLSKYGYTCEEVEKAGFPNIHKFINQNTSDRMDVVLAKTTAGLSDYFHEVQPDLLVVHGDRVETLAGAAVGALNQIRTVHIEGGEVSGTVDELIRHAVTKLSHIHFVANEDARARLLQLGERDDSIYVIGSPDIDAMNSQNLPSLAQVQDRYGIRFSDYGVLLFHPVTSEVHDLKRQARVVVDQVLASGMNYVVVYPNNDHGTDYILNEYDRLRGSDHIRIFPSIRFEYFLTILKEAQFVIGNSSVGVREAPHYGIPAINLGVRQNNRAHHSTIINCTIDPSAIASAIKAALSTKREPVQLFGQGDSADRVIELMRSERFWRHPVQKYFVDRNVT